MNTRPWPIALLLCSLIVGCLPQPPAPTTTGLRVVCTTTLVADLVRTIGGEAVDVEALMGPQIDPHRYQPTSGDIEKLSRAQLVFFHGLHLEGKMTDVLENNPRLKGIAITRDIPVRELLSGGMDGGAHDPHVWFDRDLWTVCAGTVLGELRVAMPEKAVQFQANYDRWCAGVAAKLAPLEENLKALPAERKILVTSHDAFEYFGRRYGFAVHGLQGVSTSNETGTTEIGKLADLIGTKKIPAVFTETSVQNKGLARVLDDVRTRYRWDVAFIGGEQALYSDALGEATGPAGDYAGMMAHNLTVILKALSP